jgi:hypothetical protein
VITDPAERSRLLSELQHQLRERLTPLLQAMFDELEVRLFDLAERSRIATQQHVYFDGLRECRRNRTDIEHDYLEAIASSLRPPMSGNESTHPAPVLSLVAHDELEESLALSALAERTAARQAVALDALDKRIAMLQNVARDPSEPMRLSPQLLGTLFRHNCQRLDVGIEIRLVAYSLFGQHVLDALESIYAELNRELIAAGVLPAIAPPPRRSAPARETERQENRSSASSAGPGSATARDEDAFVALMKELRSLMPVAPTTPAPTAAASHTEGRALSPRQLLQALDHLDRSAEEPHRLKARLLDASLRLGNAPGASLTRQDEHTVDLIGMLFDAVQSDSNLSAPLQPVIAALQVPFLKLALLDPDVMQTADHPARRLVDELGELALGWTASSDPEGQLLTRISQIVESLRQPQEAGPGAFERATAELNQYLEIGRHRADLAEQRAVEAALGRERLRIARTRVAAMLERRLSRYSPLPWVRQLLRGPWANYLVLLWLRQGESGESFRQAFAFVDELLWCDEHGQATPDEARLRADQDELEDDLRYGLATVAYHDREVERLASELRQFIGSLLRRRSPPPFVYEIDPKLGSADFSQSWSEHELEDQPDRDQVDPALLTRLRNLAPGTWFEFGARQGERAKLSWSSPFSGRCLFVNRNGMRVDEIAPERLASDIEQGLTRILESTRLLQRAIQTLLVRIRNGEQGNQESA